MTEHCVVGSPLPGTLRFGSRGGKCGAGRGDVEVGVNFFRVAGQYLV